MYSTISIPINILYNVKYSFIYSLSFDFKKVDLGTLFQFFLEWDSFNQPNIYLI